MNLLLLTPADREGDGWFVRGPRAVHVREVLGSAPGDTLRVGLLGGPAGEALVVEVAADAVRLAWDGAGVVPPTPPTVLVLAVPRPKSLKKLLPELGAMGLEELVLVRSWRVGKPYLTADVMEPAVRDALLLEGLAQGRATCPPRVTVEPLFRPFVEDRAPALAREALALVAHPSAPASMASVRVDTAQRVVLAVGPEGGWIPYELEALARAGFMPVSMGERPLRVETACVALLAQLALLRAQAGETDAATLRAP